MIILIFVEVEIQLELMDFFTSITQTIEMRDYLLTIFAYMLHGNKRLEEFYILTGSGGNGKSVCALLLKLGYGDYFYQPDITIFTQKKNDSSRASPELAKTKGKRCLMTSEPERDEKLQVSRLKLYTGGDQIQARALFKDTVEFTPQFGAIIQTNGIPELSNFDGGIVRRLRIFNLIYKFVENPRMAHEKKLDTTLKYKFENDTRYAQQFMIILLDYYKNKVQNKNKLDTPQEVMSSTHDYLKSQDAVGEFIKDMYDITSNHKDRIKSKILYEDFKNSEYCNNEGMSVVKFAEQLVSMGFKKVTSNGVYWVKLKKKIEFVTDNEAEEEREAEEEE